MKKTLLLTLSLAIIAISGLTAKEVQKEDARKVAINAYFEKMNQFGDGISYADVLVTYEHTQFVNGAAAYHAFDFTTGGFMIISGDDVYEAVIGYAFQGEFPKGEHAYVYSSFMQNYVDLISYIRENNIQAQDYITAGWNHLLTDKPSDLNSFRDPRDVDPLVSSLWNQDSPYNLMCPEDPNGPGGHAYVGCVATAMSQIMHYYRYPINGTNDHCYTPATYPSYGVQCADFENTYYRWTGMMDNIDSRNPIPIGEIGYHCAVGVNMNFGWDGSGAFSYMVPNRLNAFFRYNSAQYLEKTDYSQTSWEQILKDEIDVDHPLYYSGRSSTGGHAFVCDGYQGSDFHFNFGWSGYGNGYYTTTTGGVNGYYIEQAVVRYFYPTDPAYPYHNTGHVVITETSGQFTDGSGPLDDYLPNNTATWLIDPQTAEDSITDITLYFIDFDLEAGDFLRVYDGEDDSAPLLGEFTGTALPDQLTSTGNKLCISLVTDGSGNASGFKAEFYSEFPDFCVGLVTLTDPILTFDDGSGDFNYSPGMTCMYKIEPAYADEIIITFNSFDTEAEYDQVKVFDENTPLGTFSGDDIPGPFVCTGDYVFITWSTNSTINKQGWEISYEIGNVGVEEKENFTQLDIFPNPASSALNVNFSIEENQTVEMRLVNVTGEAVYSNILSNVSGSISNSIDVSDFAKGIYILNLSSAQGTINKKVIIK